MESRLTAAQAENQKSEVRYERSELEAEERKSDTRGQRSEVGSQRSDRAREGVDGEQRGLLQAARSERAASGRDDNDVGSQRSDGGDDVGEDAEVATATEGNPTADVTTAPPPPDDEGYVWPEGAEVAAETAVSSGPSAPAVAPLPSLDELVKRIPADVRETLDELFRVKYVSVKRVPASSLKS